MHGTDSLRHPSGGKMMLTRDDSSAWHVRRKAAMMDIAINGARRTSKSVWTMSSGTMGDHQPISEHAGTALDGESPRGRSAAFSDRR